MDEPEQLELLDDFDAARLFTLRVNGTVTGAFIGRLRRDDDGPVERLSVYFPCEEDAEAALQSGAWPAPSEF